MNGYNSNRRGDGKKMFPTKLFSLRHIQWYLTLIFSLRKNEGFFFPEFLKCHRLILSLLVLLMYKFFVKRNSAEHFWEKRDLIYPANLWPHSYPQCVRPLGSYSLPICSLFYFKLARSLKYAEPGKKSWKRFDRVTVNLFW